MAGALIRRKLVGKRFSEAGEGREALLPDVGKVSITRLSSPGRVIPATEPGYEDYHLPGLASFIESVKNGNGNQTTGIYIEGKLSFPVVQQPGGRPEYVTRGPILTQFNIASFGVEDDTGLLAHAFPAGGQFYKVEKADEIILVKGDGSIEKYIVTTIRRFLASDPYNFHSEFIEINRKNETIGRWHSASELFRLIYSDEDSVNDGLAIQICEVNSEGVPYVRRFIKAHLAENGKV